MEVVQEIHKPLVIKKSVSILDTRMAIQPFKMCPEILEAFVLACKCKKTGGSTPYMFGIHVKCQVMKKLLNPPQLDHLAFFKYYEVMLECNQDHQVSNFFLFKIVKYLLCNGNEFMMLHYYVIPMQTCSTLRAEVLTLNQATHKISNSFSKYIEWCFYISVPMQPTLVLAVYAHHVVTVV